MIGIPKRAAATGGVFAAALLLSACGAASSGSGATAGANLPTSGQGPTQVTVIAKEFSFSPSTVRLAVGQPVQFKLVNSGLIDHDMKAELPVQQLTYQQADNDEAEQQANAASGEIDVDYKVGHTAQITFVPTTPGTYKFFCDVPGHKEGGMTGTFVVAARS